MTQETSGSDQTQDTGQNQNQPDTSATEETSPDEVTGDIITEMAHALRTAPDDEVPEDGRGGETRKTEDSKPDEGEVDTSDGDQTAKPDDSTEVTEEPIFDDEGNEVKYEVLKSDAVVRIGDEAKSIDAWHLDLSDRKEALDLAEKAFLKVEAQNTYHSKMLEAYLTSDIFGDSRRPTQQEIAEYQKPDGNADVKKRVGDFLAREVTRQTRLNELKNEAQRIHELDIKAHEENISRSNQVEMKKLTESFPEWGKDTAVRDRALKSAKNHAKEMGIPDWENIDKILDAGSIKVLLNSLTLQKIQNRQGKGDSAQRQTRKTKDHSPGKGSNSDRSGSSFYGDSSIPLHERMAAALGSS